MKKVILNESPREITVLEASCYTRGTSPLLFAYKSEGKSGWCFLAKISVSGCVPYYGFIAMNYTDTNPRFCGSTMKEALEDAIKSRDVYAFDNVKELAQEILKG